VEFVEAAMRLLEINESLFAMVKEGIAMMLDCEDISKLCKAFEIGHGEQRGVRDTIQGEVTIQEVVFNRFLVCRNPLDKVNSEYVVKKQERESNKQTKKKTIDIVYTDHKGKRRFCFELKNIRVGDLECGKKFAVKGLEDYDQLKKISDSFAKMDEEDVLQSQLKPMEECPKWFQEDWAPTIGEFMENIKTQQVLNRYKPELQKDDSTEGRSLAWVVVRVGLGKIVFKRAF